MNIVGINETVGSADGCGVDGAGEGNEDGDEDGTSEGDEDGTGETVGYGDTDGRGVGTGDGSQKQLSGPSANTRHESV